MPVPLRVGPEKERHPVEIVVGSHEYISSTRTATSRYRHREQGPGSRDGPWLHYRIRRLARAWYKHSSPLAGGVLCRYGRVTKCLSGVPQNGPGDVHVPARLRCTRMLTHVGKGCIVDLSIAETIASGRYSTVFSGETCIPSVGHRSLR